jgi:hypothetical protein
VPIIESDSEKQCPEVRERITVEVQICIEKVLKGCANHLFKKEGCLLQRNFI